MQLLRGKSWTASVSNWFALDQTFTPSNDGAERDLDVAAAAA